MHQVYYVLTPKENNENQTPLEAMNEAQGELDSNAFCYADGGYFAGGKCDWYVVGGRWATLLCDRHEWAREAEKEIQTLLTSLENLDARGEPLRLRGVHYGSSDQQKKQAELREKAEIIWGKYRPPEYPKVRYDRWSDDEGNSMLSPATDDCAELLTEELLNYLADYADGVEVFNPSEYEETTIAYIKEHSEDYVGKYWLTVVDYHS